MTFDVIAHRQIGYNPNTHELSCACRDCFRSIIIDVREGPNHNVPLDRMRGFNIDHQFVISPYTPVIPNPATCPAHVPEHLKRLFHEGARCLAIACYDAAGTMFRKVIDVSTRALISGLPQTLPREDEDYISWKHYKDLGLRLDWLFTRNRLPPNIKNLAACIHQDGNDAAHAIGGLTQDDADDLLDFTVTYLETMYTLPGQIAESEKRRAERREQI